jgi:hypothetical protein
MRSKETACAADATAHARRQICVVVAAVALSEMLTIMGELMTPVCVREEVRSAVLVTTR